MHTVAMGMTKKLSAQENQKDKPCCRVLNDRM